MTDQSMFDTWAQLLRPLFPFSAEISFKTRRRVICVTWVQDDDLGRQDRERRCVVIAFSHLAWKGYRGARSARRARADVNLLALVKSALAQDGGEIEGAYDFPTGELRVQVASIDLFPPSTGAVQAAAQSIAGV